MPLEEFPDPTALAEEPLGAVEICHDNSTSAPVDGNFPGGSRRAVRSADRIGRELLEEAPEIDVIVVDVTLRNLGRTDVLSSMAVRDRT